MHAQSLGHVQLFEIPQTVACWVPPSMEFSKQEYWSGLPLFLQGFFLIQGSNSHLLHWQVDSLRLSQVGSPINYHISPSETKLQAITYLTWLPEQLSIDSIIFWSLLVNVLNSKLTRAIHKEQSESHDNHNFPRLLFKLENVAIFQLFSKVLSVY